MAILIAEKGDNFFKIAYSLTGLGASYNLICARRLDRRISDSPNKIYYGMRFDVSPWIKVEEKKLETPPMIINNSSKTKDDSAWNNGPA